MFGDFGCKMTCQYIRRWPLRSRLWCKVIHCAAYMRREEMEKRPKLITFAERLTLSYFPLVRCPQRPPLSWRCCRGCQYLRSFMPWQKKGSSRPYFALSAQRKALLEIIILLIRRTGRIYFLSERTLCVVFWWCRPGVSQMRRWRLKYSLRNELYFCMRRYANKKETDNLLGG